MHVFDRIPINSSLRYKWLMPIILYRRGIILRELYPRFVCVAICSPSTHVCCSLNTHLCHAPGPADLLLNNENWARFWTHSSPDSRPVKRNSGIPAIANWQYLTTWSVRSENLFELRFRLAVNELWHRVYLCIIRDRAVTIFDKCTENC